MGNRSCIFSNELIIFHNCLLLIIYDNPIEESNLILIFIWGLGEILSLNNVYRWSSTMMFTLTRMYPGAHIRIALLVIDRLSRDLSQSDTKHFCLEDRDIGTERGDNDSLRPPLQPSSSFSIAWQINPADGPVVSIFYFSRKLFQKIELA